MRKRLSSALPPELRQLFIIPHTRNMKKITVTVDFYAEVPDDFNDFDEITCDIPLEFMLLYDGNGYPIEGAIINSYETRDVVASPATVICKFCHAIVPEATAHLHQGEWVGDECCWDERLRTTE